MTEQIGGSERTRPTSLVVTRPTWLVVARPTWLVVVTFVLGAIAGVTASLGPLAERPLIGALTHPSIQYAARPTSDLVAALNRRVADGDARLTFDPGTGYLRSVLDALHVPVESQMLVMSKTGIQALHTSPANPRAIYFNDAVSIGYIRGAPMLEFAVQDPEQGIVFYVLDQKASDHPVIERRQGCLTCHQVYSTLHVPGMLERSTLVGPDGLGGSVLGIDDPDDRTPFGRRWGGWYVTGTHGSMRHLGNAILGPGETRETMVSDRTLNRTSLDGLFDARDYLSARSDIAALMVFLHQVRMMNLITRVGWEVRMTAHDRAPDFTGGPLREAVAEFVDELLFVDEQPLMAAVKGTSGFAETFNAPGPADRRGRSLRQLDLERRLLRYPCSYMIYSAAFQGLPAEARAAIYGRMWEILSGRATGLKYTRLAETDRQAVVGILRDTVPDLPKDFLAGHADR